LVRHTIVVGATGQCNDGCGREISVILIMELVLLEKAFSENDVVPISESGD
jgi:hypothetical protein